MATQLSMIPVSKPNVFIHNGKAVTTSRYVADYFIKRHDDVLKKIRQLDCSAEFNARNFADVEYTDTKGEKRPMYEMTKDGFVFLVMGFTGKKAAAFKEAYIAEFNRMEAELNHRKSVPVPEPEFYTLKLTGEEFSDLCWLCRVADNMRMGARTIYPAMRDLGASCTGICYDMAVESTITLRNSKQILARAVRDAKITGELSPNWRRILPWLHGNMN
ncbi:Rha family transcriptional regulator [Salmonella enterica]|nr:Rha family transcriptional regulator [Salmonella enterica]